MSSCGNGENSNITTLNINNILQIIVMKKMKAQRSRKGEGRPRPHCLAQSPQHPTRQN